MADDVRISNPIQIQNSSKEQVAFDLMRKISQFDGVDRALKNKEYWLTLYYQCLCATSGESLESILKVE